jgi:hypothetical protein
MAMDKIGLSDLLEGGDFISGIHNYCDRWCERCPFTSRCLVYAIDKDHELDDLEVHDINNAKFWRRLESIFKEAREMISKWAAEAGADLEALDVEAAQEAHRLQRDAAKLHELSVSARRYAQMAQKWFEEEFTVEQNVHDDTSGKSKSAAEDIDVSDAVAVIRWYQLFIAAKIFRALTGAGNDAEELAEDEDFAGEMTPDDIQNDANGSAKLALIAIDRSLSAWRVMQSSLPENTIMPMLLELERLYRATKQTFPNAMDFVRPGFDEALSEFVS